jgi:hypothetical protein
VSAETKEQSKQCMYTHSPKKPNKFKQIFLPESTGWSRGNACFSYKNNFVDFQDKTILINKKEGILMHF